MRREALRNKKIEKKQQTLIQALEGIGDILAFETRQKNRNKRVINGLGKLKDFTQELFAIQREDPERFERLVLSQDILDYYEEEIEKAQVVLAINPSKYLVSFSTAVSQFIKIYESAREVGNEEIYKYSAYHLGWMLSDLCMVPGNNLFVEQLLRTITGITQAAIEEDDISRFSASTGWYIDVVFKLYKKNGDNFDLSYLRLLDQYFFSIARYIVTLDRFGLFRSLVSSLIDEIHIPSYYSGKVWEYGHIILRSDYEAGNKLDKECSVEERIRELYRSQQELFESKQLEEWSRRFHELEIILEPFLSEDQKIKSAELKAEIKEYVYTQYKYNDLLENVFALAAFCLREQRPEYIRFLWEYKQPPDANGKWAGHDIVPESIDSLMSFYFKKGLFERGMDFWDGHHGSEIYYKKYFLLLLAKILQSIRPSLKNVPDQSLDFRLPDLNVYRLSDMEYSIDGLIKIATELQQQTDLFESLGFRIDELEDTFSKLITFLSLLKDKAKKRIGELLRSKNLSKGKLQEFKDNVWKSFNENAVMRSIMESLGKVKDKTHEAYKGAIKRIGTQYVSDKAAFLDEWYVHYLDWGKNEGRAIAAAEDSFILQILFKFCRHIDNMDFYTALSTFDDFSDLVVLACNVDPNNFFDSDDNYVPTWQIAGFDPNEDALISGYYLKDKRIPVYKTFSRNMQETILLLNKNSIGNLVQYSPIDDELEPKYEIFYINVEVLSENDELVKEYLSDPPDWLKEIESDKDREDYLKERVIIQIYERFEYRVTEDMCGLILTGRLE
jgi:hypothetical protein